MEVGSFNKFENTPQQFAVLVDGRPGDNQGLILQHPLFDELLSKEKKLPPRFGTQGKYLVDVERLGQLESAEGSTLYSDPLGKDEAGKRFREDYIAGSAGVKLDSQRLDINNKPMNSDTGLIVLVQEDYDAVIGPVRQLGARLTREGILALHHGGLVRVGDLVLCRPRHRALPRRRTSQGPYAGAVDTGSQHGDGTGAKPSEPTAVVVGGPAFRRRKSG